MNYYINDYEVISALGISKEQHLSNLFSCKENDQKASHFFVDADLSPIPDQYQKFDSKNNRLIFNCLQQMNDQFISVFNKVDKSRVGVIIGTSTSGIEDAIHQIKSTYPGPLENVFNYSIQEIGSSSEFIQNYLGLGPICYNVSTACTSGVRSLIEARRYLELDLCDVVIVGGADSFSELTFHGFDCLESLSKKISNPFSKNRDGINIGEGVALFIVSKDEFLLDNVEAFKILGIGESSDSYHISSPDPSGAGAIQAMKNALADANLLPPEIDYINLHGTGTMKNDEMEAIAVDSLFTDKPYVSSTKPITGHALGAAGALEMALLCLLLSKENRDAQGYSHLPPHLWDKKFDESIKPLRFVEQNEKKVLNKCMSNSYAFGGNNVSVIIGRAHEP